ncbi:dienelactone hydrolase family protein [Nocardioides sp. GCM10027113]|uniref:dienelactone hydrolase family protein n=1 Tax=unclassified Nocardioides TaxID=2615069 RepID=UPI00360AAF49
MAEVLLFHHALGLTPGVVELAERMRAAGHTVHTPDLYDGHVFDDLEAGVGYAREVGFEEVRARGLAAAEGLPDGLVYAGISLGVVPAQQLAQTRPGAAGALLLEACLPATELADGWPDGVPVQVHGMDADPFFAEEGDLDAARALAAAAPDAEVFTYPGDRHLFVDPGLPSFDPEAAALLGERVLAFLDRVGATES